MTCSVLDCDKPPLARSVCQFHYDARRRYPDRDPNYTRPKSLRCLECGADFDIAPRGSIPALCPPCTKADHRRKTRDNRKRSSITQHGISLDEFESLKVGQGGLCAICGAAPGRGRGDRLHIDHDHVTGNVRGLLCHYCNVGLGVFQDDRRRLEGAIKYLEAFRGH